MDHKRNRRTGKCKHESEGVVLHLRSSGLVYDLNFSSCKRQMFLTDHDGHVSYSRIITTSIVWLDQSIDFMTKVSSIKWEFINMTEQEEDLIYRMYRLVGDRWGLIAGRIPGRKAEEIERFWIMRHSDGFAEKRKQKKS